MKRNGHFFLSSALCCALSFFARPLHAVNIGDNFRISNMGPDASAAYDANFARVAYNSTDNQYLVVWSGDDDSLTDNEFEIWGQLLDADGVAIGVTFRISEMGPEGNTSYGAFDPAVTYNSDANQYFVVWFGDHDVAPLVDNEFEVWGQLLDANGTEVGGDTRLSDMGSDDGNSNYGALYPSVAYNSTDNEYLVVWQGDDDTPPLVDNEYEAWGQLVNASGVEVGLDFRISDMGPDGTNLYVVDNPTVAYNDTDNQYMVVWSGDDDTPPLVDNAYEIFGQLLNANATEDGGDLRLSNVGPDVGFDVTAYSAIAPQIAYNSTENQYLVVWYGDNNSGALLDDEYEVWGQLVDADGVEDGSDFRVSNMGDDGDVNANAGNTSVSYSSSSNLYLVAWRGDDGAAPLIDNEIEIWGQLINADGSAEGTDERISDAGPDGSTAYMALAPAIAYNSTNNGFLVVWHGDDNFGSLVDNELEIFGQFFNNPIDCPLGRYSATGDDDGDRGSCTPCEAGSYQDITGQTECISCPAGYYQDADGARFCWSCDVGTVQPDEGQTSCDVCPAGTYQDEMNQTECIPCAVGYFQPAEQSISCFMCGPGTVQPDTGQASCDDCDAGSYQDETHQTECKLCAAGTYQPDTGADACIDCNYGRFQPDTGQTSCEVCPVGYHQDELGQTECKACAAGKFNATEGEAFCDNCLPGSYTDETAQTECISCSSGSYQDLPGQTSCSACAAGSYSDVNGADACTLCVADTFAAEAGATSCEACADGFTSDEGALECSEVVDDSGDDDTTDETPAVSSGCQLIVS